jgi:hypothetical protein
VLTGFLPPPKDPRRQHALRQENGEAEAEEEAQAPA